MVLTRNTPQRRNADSNTSSEPVSEPVWEAAARADNDWFGQCHFARRGHEGTRVTDGFHINHDAVSVWVIAQVIDQIAPADI